MGMSEKMVSWLYIQNSVSQWSIAPMGTSRLVEYHDRRFMRNHDINFIWYQFFWMIVGQPKEFHSIYLNATILQEIHVGRQILNPLRIP